MLLRFTPGVFADADNSTRSEAEFGRIVDAVDLGVSLGLRVNARARTQLR